MERQTYRIGRAQAYAKIAIEDVTLVKSEKVSIHVRFRGGRTTSLTVDKPRSMALVRKTQPAVVTVIDGLLETCTDQQVATRLNELGYTNWQHQTFTARKVALGTDHLWAAESI